MIDARAVHRSQKLRKRWNAWHPLYAKMLALPIVGPRLLARREAYVRRCSGIFIQLPSEREVAADRDLDITDTRSSTP